MVPLLLDLHDPLIGRIDFVAMFPVKHVRP
jgi:hypothetical protein